MSGYTLRIAVRRNRWHITSFNPKTEVETFSLFEALGTFRKRASTCLSHLAQALHQDVADTLLTR